MSDDDIIYLNIGGLTTNKHEIELLAKKRDPSIILMSETHLTENIENEEVNIKNYKLLRCDSHSRHTGGVAIYIKNRIRFSIINKESYIKNVWTLAIKINQKKMNGVLAVVYHSPSTSDVIFMDYFNDWCEQNLSSDCINVITGDFNVNLLVKDANSVKMIDIIKRQRMKQFVTKPTRTTQTSKSLIDYVISNNFTTTIKILEDEKISDHETISFSLKQSLKPKKQCKKVTKLVGYSKEKFVDNLLNVQWENSLAMELNQKASYVIDNVKNSLTEFIKTMSVKDRSGEVWYNDQLYDGRKKAIEAYNKAKVSESSIDWNMSKFLNKKYTDDVRKTRSDYYQRKLSAASGNQRETWKILKKIINGQQDEQLDAVEFDGNLAKNNYEIVTKFNEYYVDSVKQINESISEQSELGFVQINRVMESFKFKQVTQMDVTSVIKAILSKGDPELITKDILLDAMPIINPSFIDIVNTSFEQGKFMDKWKTSIINPSPKIPGTIKGEEHRPINSLPSYEKVIEGIVKNQLEEFTNKNQIIIDEQFGFRETYSCELALNELIWNWKNSIDEGCIIVAVFLDLKRAFETIDRYRLLKKLEIYGVRGAELEWFKSYLSDRTQRTRYNGVTSDEIRNDIGLPQGSKLAAILFIIYINDIKSCLLFALVILFADDTLLHVHAKTMDEAFQKINEDLERVSKWLNLNRLKLNVSKCKYMVINGKQGTLESEAYKIRIDGAEIERVDEYKYLGFILHHKMSLKRHCEYVCKKTAKKIGFLARIGHKLTKQHKITLYNSIIEPHFQYCASVLSMFNGQEFNQLQKQQNKAMRVVLRCGRRTSVNWMLESLGWLNIRQRIMFLTMVMVFKIKNGIVPDYISRNVNYIHSDRYPLRCEGKFNIKRVNKTTTKNNVFNDGLRMYNGLPAEIRNERNLNLFKSKLKVYVKENCFIIV